VVRSRIERTTLKSAPEPLGTIFYQKAASSTPSAVFFGAKQLRTHLGRLTMRAKWFWPAPVLLFGGLLVLPAPAADAPTKAELELASNYLQQIGIAFHNLADTADMTFTDDLTDKDGRPLLSWRVALLPYLEEENLYKEFKLDEPWDSEHNKKLIPKMPKVYAPVRVKAKAGETFLQRFVGKGALFNEKGVAYKVPKIPDGTSNTALVVEAGDPVIWTKPADLPFNLKGPLPKLGGLFDGDFHILLCDGSVSLFKKNFDVAEMKKVVQPDDGMTIDLDKLQK
jgi:hypothetical protein